MANSRAVAAEGFAKMGVAQAEADMSEVDRDLEGASDSLGPAACGDFNLRIASDAAAAAPRRGLAGMQLLLETPRRQQE